MPSKNKRSVLPLLHIDDDPIDRFLIEQAIHSTNTPFEFHGAHGLAAAMDFFPFLPQIHHPRPAFILLDYNLGARCGTDFLYWLRAQQRNTATPVIMYSGSADDGHIAECYANGANHFLRKAQSLTRIHAVVTALYVCFYRQPPWFEFLARLPESEPDPRKPSSPQPETSQPPQFPLGN